MNPTLRNILAVLAGIILGSIVNMAILMISGYIIPSPNGVDVTTMEGLKSTMHLFAPKHFIFPFLAHALGTFAGAYVTAKVAATSKMKLALLIGVLFLAGGTANVIMLSAPVWFNIIDLVLAYIPMAFLGGKAAFSNRKNISASIKP